MKYQQKLWIEQKIYHYLEFLDLLKAKDFTVEEIIMKYT